MSATGYMNGKQTPTYRAWSGMKTRCFNRNHKDYAHYGARGVTVCERWLVFANFLADMGERPDGMTIDRIDGKKDYEPGNCRWATRKTQRINRSDVRFAEVDTDAIGVTAHAVRARVRRGWSMAEATTTSKTNGWETGRKQPRRAP